MPSHSRSRDRYGRDQDRLPRPAQSRRRYHEDYDDDYDDDLEESPRDRRYRRDGYRRARVDDDLDYDRDLDGRNAPAAYDDPDMRRTRAHSDRRQRERSKPKESLAASPRKSDRNRDRENHRHHRTDDEDASPVPRAGRSRPRESHRERRRGLDSAEEGPEEAVRNHRRRDRERERTREKAARASKHQSADSTNSAAHLLSADALAKLGAHYEKEDRLEKSRAKDAARADRKRRRKRPVVEEASRTLDPFPDHVPRGQSKGRIVSGAYLEEGRGPEMKVRHRGGGGEPPTGNKWAKEKEDPDYKPPFWKRKKWIFLGVLILLLIIIIPVAVVVSKKKESPSSGSTDSTSSDSSNSNLDGLNHDSIPTSAQGTYLDPWTWYDTTDFNVTYTSETVGGLSIMGLNSTWDDSARPNENVPPLNEPFPYGSQPIRGVNLGGWLSLEPFITPSLFKAYSSDGVVDEWTLCEKLGSAAASTIEQHYATFITEQDFADIADAGLDHVRIQYSYWAVAPIDGEPYVPRTAWRYLLRAIEYCRKYGLRVNLDPHGIPGSQNGWNHSGRQGDIRWLNSTEGDLNRKRSLDFHNQVSQFFAQDRYRNIVTIYGLVNEPLMLSLSVADVLDWTTEAAKLVQSNGITAYIAFHDGFLNLSKWKQMLKSGPAGLLLDTHQYTIFNTGQIVLSHDEKVNLVCDDWHSMIGGINSTSTGWGPTICGEWSQADTDCAQYLNNVGRGTRWEGTYSTTDSTEYCPTADAKTCSCINANADVSDYSDDYKTFLLTYAEAQMSAFAEGMGWFYWTWLTESAPQWSYKTAWKNGFMPSKAYAPTFTCDGNIPGFGTLPDYY